ncbi:phage major capsid protein [Limosilactobacillus albertensis]|uniref:Phage major capsid protein n=1 Tax=Limosilactobacillus albertensis TaxID=2759752 RepID=A0A839HBE6_9LACO|nr:phage major capsid protein [Limosilactobacillus albertensis]MBB1123272.1 phage major capsid protein [Limosilactobacillus albertensis]MCD7121316.1 phage major capsid protein [Limosilactobacillus albertensis]
MMTMLTINELNDAWIAKGQKVSDLNAQLNAAVLDDNFMKDKFAELKTKRDNLAAQRDAIKDQLDEARANEVLNMSKKDKKPLNKKELNTKDQFVRDFKNMVRGRFDAITSSVEIDADGNGGAGLTIPIDVQTAIHELVRQFATLQNLVNVESVSTTSGSRVYETLSDITPMKQMDSEDGLIPDGDDPKLHLIKYLIKEYGAINTITNNLLKDTAENIMSWLENWIAKKVAVTRNVAIISVMNKATKKPTITKMDDIKDLENNTLDPAIMATSTFVTNQSGYNVLSKVKDAEGRYMIQPDVTQADRYLLNNKPITVIADKWLPDVSGSHPLYFGDFKEAITLYDREHMSLLTTNIGAGAYEHNTTKIRCIDRFDVQMIDDGAIATGSFKTVANQTATTPEASGKTA